MQGEDICAAWAVFGQHLIDNHVQAQLTQNSAVQEKLSKHLSLNVHPMTQVTKPQCSVELGLL